MTILNNSNNKKQNKFYFYFEINMIMCQCTGMSSDRSILHVVISNENSSVIHIRLVSPSFA